MNSLVRLSKLRSMPPAEVAHRLGYRLFLARERRLHRRGVLSDSSRLQRALVPRLHAGRNWRDRLLARDHGGARAFFRSVHAAPRMRELFQTAYCEEAALTRRTAEQALRHELFFFGETFRYGDRIDWHADPQSWRRWPVGYHADIRTHGGDIGFGDVKYVWETNRHQFFVDIAKLVFLDRDAGACAALTGLLTDWRHENPYGTGVSWACALEPAFRAMSWLWAYHLCRESGVLDDDAHLQWLTGLYEHGHFLHRHLEVYSSPYNHLAGEASTLYMLGVLLPEFKEAAAWRRHGRRVLERTVERQFHPDGGSVEQSTFYHHATLGFYLMASVLGRNNGEELSGAVRAAIERGIEFSMHLAWPDGMMPSIGGGDDGKPIRMEHLRLWDFRPYQAMGAVLFGRPDFRHAATRFWEDALWMLGAEGLEAFEAVTPAPPAGASKVLPASGYAVFRSGWNLTADYVCFDCGPQAAGLRKDAIPSAAHGHADCLSVIVALGGQRVLVDPGFYCYNGDPAWEVHFRKTRAHNTAVIDGRDQALHISKMVWSRTYTPSMEAWQTGAAGPWVRGAHDGYARSAAPVVHRRTVWLRPAGYVILYDEFTGIGAHLLELNFQFAPGSLSDAAKGTSRFNDRFDLHWHSSIPLTPAVVSGGPEPADGWIAPSLGIRCAAPRLSLSGRFAGDHVSVLTLVLDRTRVTVPDSRTTFGADEDNPAVIVRCGDLEERISIPAGPGSPLGLTVFREGVALETVAAAGTSPARGAHG